MLVLNTPIKLVSAGPSLSIMETLLREKFKNKELADRLKAIKEEIVEGNTWGDVFWGVCKGVGENHLGKLLMKVRQEL